MDFRYYDHEKLKKLRESKGLTQSEVAEKIGKDRQTVFRAESGHSVSYELLCTLCTEVYDVDVTSVLHARPLTAAA